MRSQVGANLMKSTYIYRLPKYSGTAEYKNQQFSNYIKSLCNKLVSQHV